MGVRMGWFGKGSKKGKQAKKPRKKQMYWPGETCILEPIITPSAPVVPGSDQAVDSPILDFDSPLSGFHLATNNLIQAPDGSALVHPIPSLDVPIAHPDIEPLPYIYNNFGNSDFCPVDPFNPSDPNLFPVDLDVPGAPISVNPGTGGGAIGFPVDPTNPPPIVVPVDPPGGNFDFKKSDQPLVGIIDTGFSGNNPDIDYSNITVGHDYVGNDANPLLQNGEGSERGTHVLGVITAQQDNEIGIDGINDKAPIWVSRANSRTWADSLMEFVDAAKKSGQPNAVVNINLDLTKLNTDGSVIPRLELTQQERLAIEYARQNQVIIVVPGGNNPGQVSALGKASLEFDNIITVGSAAGKQVADYSGTGEGLDILAEGGTLKNPVPSTVGEGIGLMAGTSVAAAKVTGAVSQVWAANPNLNYTQVLDILKSTATDLEMPGWDVETGAGLLNIAAAVDLAKATKAEPFDKQPPIVLNPVSDITLTLTQPTKTIDLSQVFADPEGKLLRYEIIDGESDSLSLSLDGNQLQLTAQLITDLNRVAIRAVDSAGNATIHSWRVITSNLSNETVQALEEVLKGLQVAIALHPGSLAGEEAIEKFSNLVIQTPEILKVLLFPDSLITIGISESSVASWRQLLPNLEFGNMLGLPVSLKDAITEANPGVWDRYQIKANDLSWLISEPILSPPVAFLDFTERQHDERVIQTFASVNPQAYYEKYTVSNGNWASQLVNFVNQQKAAGKTQGIVNLSFDLTQIDDEGQVTTRYELTPEEQQAIQYARENNILLVVAAGNTGAQMSALGAAAEKFDNIITVGAVDRWDEKADYSATGNGLSLVAPGGQWENDPDAFVGTSRAAAYVTAAASLVWAANSELNYKQVKELLLQTADDLATAGWDEQTGAGLLDVEEAIALAKETEPQPLTVSESPEVTPFSGEGRVRTLERAASAATLEAIEQLKTQQANLNIQLQKLLADPNISLEQLQKIVSNYTAKALEEYQTISKNAAIAATETGLLVPKLALALQHYQIEAERLQTLEAKKQELENVLKELEQQKTDLDKSKLEFSNQSKKTIEAIDQDIKIAEAKLNYQLIDPNLFKEPGNSLTTAKKVTLENTYEGFIGNQDTDDYYRIDLLNDGDFSVQVTGLAKDAQVKLEILNSQGNSVSSFSNSNQGIQSINSLGLKAGTYYVKLHANQGSSNYKMHLAAVQELAVTNQSTIQQDVITNTEPENYYRVELTKDSNLKLTLNNLKADANIQVLDRNGKVIATAARTANQAETINLPDLKADTYYIRVYPAKAGSNTDYQLNLLATSEPGETLETAKLITIKPTATTNKDFVGESDIADYYRFDLNETSNVSLNLTGIQKNADADIELLDSQGNLIRIANQLGNKNESILQSLEAGTYYIKVSRFAGNTDYNLSYSATPDIGNSRLTAKVLSISDKPTIEKQTVGESDPEDFYRFELKTTSNLGLDITGLKADGKAEILDLKGNIVSVSTPNGKNKQSIDSSLTAGTYFIRVAQSQDKSDYTLSVTAKADGNTRQSAQNITVSPEVTNFSGSITTQEPNKYYRFELDKPSSLKLNLTGLTANADIKLLDSQGKEINNSKNLGNKAEALTSPSLNAGVYYIQILAGVTGAKTSYNLQVSATPEPGNILKQAQDITVGFQAKTYNNFIGQGDYKDYYRFELKDRSNFSLDVTGLKDASVKLLDESGGEIATSKLNAQGKQLIHSNIPAGTYYLEFSQNETSQNNSNYSFSVKAITDVGNSLDEAKTLSIKTTPQYQSESIGGLDVADVYQFNLNKRSTIKIDLTELTADADVQVLDDAGKLIVSSTRGDRKNESIVRELKEGSYYIRVIPNSEKTTNYKLGLSATPVEPGESLSEATLIAVTSNPIAYKEVVGGNDAGDYYKFELTTGSNFKLALQGLTANAEVELLDAEGKRIVFSENKGTANEAISRYLEAGTYYIRVYPALNSKASTNYSLNLSATSYQVLDPNVLMVEPAQVRQAIEQQRQLVAEYRNRAEELLKKQQEYQQLAKKHNDRGLDEMIENIPFSSAASLINYARNTLKEEYSLKAQIAAQNRQELLNLAVEAETEGKITNLEEYAHFLETELPNLSLLKEGNVQDTEKLITFLKNQIVKQEKAAQVYWDLAKTANLRQEANQTKVDSYQASINYWLGLLPNIWPAGVNVRAEIVKYQRAQNEALAMVNQAKQDYLVWEKLARQNQDQIDGTRLWIETLQNRIHDWENLKQGINAEIMAHNLRRQAEQDLKEINEQLLGQQLKTLEFDISETNTQINDLKNQISAQNTATDGTENRWVWFGSDEQGELKSAPTTYDHTQTRLNDTLKEVKTGQTERVSTVFHLQKFLATDGSFLSEKGRLDALDRQIYQLGAEVSSVWESIQQLKEQLRQGASEELEQQWHDSYSYLERLQQELQWAIVQRDTLALRDSDSEQRKAIAELISKLQSNTVTDLKSQKYIDNLTQIVQQWSSSLPSLDKDKLSKKIEDVQNVQSDVTKVIQRFNLEVNIFKLEEQRLEVTPERDKKKADLDILKSATNLDANQIENLQKQFDLLEGQLTEIAQKQKQAKIELYKLDLENSLSPFWDNLAPKKKEQDEKRYIIAEQKESVNTTKAELGKLQNQIDSAELELQKQENILQTSRQFVTYQLVNGKKEPVYAWIDEQKGKAAEAEIQNLNKSLTNLRQQKTPLEQQLNEQQTELQRLAGEIQPIDAEVEKLSRPMQLQKLRGYLKELEVNLDKEVSEKAIANTQSDLNTVSQDILNNQSEIDTHQANLRDYDRQIEEARETAQKPYLQQAEDYEQQRKEHQKVADSWNAKIRTWGIVSYQGIGFLRKPVYGWIYNKQAEQKRDEARNQANTAVLERDKAIEQAAIKGRKAAEDKQQELATQIETAEDRLAELNPAQSKLLKRKQTLENQLKYQNDQLDKTKEKEEIEEEITTLEKQLTDSGMTVPAKPNYFVLSSNWKQQLTEKEEDIKLAEEYLQQVQAEVIRLDFFNKTDTLDAAFKDQREQWLKVTVAKDEVTTPSTATTPTNTSLVTHLPLKIDDGLLPALEKIELEVNAVAQYYQNKVNTLNEQIKAKQDELTKLVNSPWTGERQTLAEQLQKLQKQLAQQESEVKFVEPLVEEIAELKAELTPEKIAKPNYEDLVSVYEKFDRIQELMRSLSSHLAQSVEDSKQYIKLIDSQQQTERLTLQKLVDQNAPLQSTQANAYNQAQIAAQNIWYWSNGKWNYNQNQAASYRENLQKSSFVADERNKLWQQQQQTVGKINDLVADKERYEIEIVEKEKQLAALKEIVDKSGLGDEIGKMKSQIDAVEKDLQAIATASEKQQEQQAIASNLTKITENQNLAIQRLINFGILASESEIDYFSKEVKPKVEQLIAVQQEQAPKLADEFKNKIDSLKGKIAAWEEERKQATETKIIESLNNLIDQTNQEIKDLEAWQAQLNGSQLKDVLQEAIADREKLSQKQALEIRTSLENLENRIKALEEQQKSEEAATIVIASGTLAAHQNLYNQIRQDLEAAVTRWTKDLQKGHQETKELGEAQKQLSLKVDELIARIKTVLADPHGKYYSSLADLPEQLAILNTLTARQDELAATAKMLEREKAQVQLRIARDTELWKEIDPIVTCYGSESKELEEFNKQLEAIETIRDKKLADATSLRDDADAFDEEAKTSSLATELNRKAGDLRQQAQLIEQQAEAEANAEIDKLRQQFLADYPGNGTAINLLQESITAHLAEAAQPFEQAKLEESQNGAYQAAALAQARWYDQRAKYHWERSHKQGPTWTEQRKTWKRDLFGKKEHWVEITHIDHDWILWNTYQQFAAKLYKQGVAQLDEAEKDSRVKERYEPLVNQWSDTATAISNAEQPITAARQLVEQLEAGKVDTSLANQQKEILSGLVSIVSSQLAEAQTEAQAANEKVLNEWQEYSNTADAYRQALETILTERSNVEKQAIQTQQELEDVERWVEQQSIALATELQQVKLLQAQLEKQRNSLQNDLESTTGDNPEQLQTKLDQIKQSLQWVTNKAAVLTAQQAALTSKRTFLTAQNEVIIAEQRLLDAYLVDPDADTSNLERQLSDARKSLKEAKRLAEQAQTSSLTLSEKLTTLQENLLAQNDEHIKAAREHQEALKELAEQTELSANYAIQAAQAQQKLNDIETQIVIRLQQAIQAGNQQAKKLLEVAQNQDMATAAEIYLRDYSDIASDKRSSSAGGVGTENDQKLAANYFQEWLRYSQLKNRAQAQANALAKAKRTAQSQLKTLQGQQTELIEELRILNEQLSASKEAQAEKEQKLAVAQAKLDAILEIRDRTEQTFIQLVSLEKLNLAQAELEQQIAEYRNAQIDEAVKARQERERRELERQWSINVANFQQILQRQAEADLQSSLNQARSSLQLSLLNETENPVELENLLADALQKIQSQVNGNPDLQEALEKSGLSNINAVNNPQQLVEPFGKVLGNLQNIDFPEVELPQEIKDSLAEFKAKLAVLLPQTESQNNQVSPMGQGSLNLGNQDIPDTVAAEIQKRLTELTGGMTKQIEQYQTEIQRIELEDQWDYAILQKSQSNLQEASQELLKQLEISGVLKGQQEQLLPLHLQMLQQVAYANQAVNISSSLAQESKEILEKVLKQRTEERKARKKYFMQKILGLINQIIGIVGTILGFTPLAPLGAALLAVSGTITAIQAIMNGDFMGAIFQIVMAGLSGLTGGLAGFLGQGAAIVKMLETLQIIASGAFGAVRSFMSGDSIMGFLQILGSVVSIAQTGFSQIIGQLSSTAQQLLGGIFNTLQKAPTLIYKSIKAIESGDWFSAISNIFNTVVTLGTSFAGMFGNAAGEFFDNLGKIGNSIFAVVGAAMGGSLESILAAIQGLLGIWGEDIKAFVDSIFSDPVNPDGGNYQDLDKYCQS